jgi:hypothetical protein
MYFPYLRGKQNELILLRDNADLISQSSITPIIEPVKSNIKPLIKCIESLVSVDAEFILIVNSSCGDLAGDNTLIIDEVIQGELLQYRGLTLGYILDEEASLEALLRFSQEYSEFNIALIHFGYLNGAELSKAVSGLDNIKAHIFIEKHAQRRYRSRFQSDAKKVLIRDGFIKRSNREYPPSEPFSELHIMYRDEGVEGFGDFLITGEEFSESGGPAYAVAIHLTYLDGEMEDDMYVNHYVSDRNSTPADPGGKFLEALEKLTTDLNVGNKIYQSKATAEFKKLHANKHFPGLGVVKKLSMQHHIELIADFLSKVD